MVSQKAPQPKKVAGTKLTTTGPRIVRVGHVVELSGPNGFAVLPDGGSVSCRVAYVIRHAGLHIIDGVEYLAR